ncbi:MAG: hypothetical protein IJX53_05815 [Clostridia bacterium]|nr:hypothetical protein [Clostridia bacterium]
MDAILAHPLPVIALLIAIFATHILEARAAQKGNWAALGFVLHLVMIVFFVFIGATLEELLLVLLLSAVVALA